MPPEFKPFEPLYFDTSGRIIKVFGRESISNPNIVVLEMIKNSWDADATSVEVIFEEVLTGKGKLTIRDNGSGMTWEEIKNNWMTAATDNKEENPLTKIYKRSKIGEKGMARFGLENISDNLLVVSKPINENCGFRIEIDWKKYYDFR